MKAQLRVDFQGRSKVETFSRARVLPMGDGVQLTLSVDRQVRALGQVLAQQPVRVFIGAALPGAVWVGKEDLDREALGQLLVFGHLFPSIIGQGFPQQGRHMAKFFGKARSGTRCIGRVHLGQEHQACGPLHQGADRRAIAGSLDEIAFPVPGTVRVTTSAGRSAIGVILGIWPRRSVPRARGRRALRA